MALNAINNFDSIETEINTTIIFGKIFDTRYQIFFCVIRKGTFWLIPLHIPIASTSIKFLDIIHASDVLINKHGFEVEIHIPTHIVLFALRSDYTHCVWKSLPWSVYYRYFPLSFSYASNGWLRGQLYKFRNFAVV